MQSSSAPSITNQNFGRTLWRIRGLLVPALLIGSVPLLAYEPVLLLAFLGLTVFLFVWGFFGDWLILVLYALIAFSVEIDLSSGKNAITLPTEALIPFLFVTMAVTFVVTGRFRYVRSPLNVAVVLYFLVAYASLVITREPISTVKALVRDTGYVFAGYLLLQRFMTDRRRLSVLLATCAVIHFLLVVYGFLTQAAGGIRIYDDIAYPFFENHCIYAAYLVITLAFLVAFGLGYLEGRSAVAVNAAALLVAAAVALTFVRAAWISVACVLLYFLFYFRRRAASVNLILISLVLNFLAITLILTTDMGDLFVQRIRTITDTGYVANYDRLDRWLSAWRMWRDQPVHGVGYGAYPDVYPRYAVFANAYSRNIRMGAHNLYLEILAETGVIGLGVFLLMMFIFFHEATVHDPGDRDRFVSSALAGAKGAMISYLVHAFFNNLGPSDKIGISFWILMSMAPCCARLAEQSLGESWNRRRKVHRSAPLAEGVHALGATPGGGAFTAGP